MIKNLLKKLLRMILGHRSAYIEYFFKMGKYKCISFDIFDTSVFRDVKTPSEIFKRVEYRIESLDHNFYKNRINSEKICRKGSLKEEVTLEEIYKCYYSNYKIKEYKKIMEIEKEEEFISACRNEDIFRLYKIALDKGAKIIFISDVYLPELLIANILEKCGYTKYDKLFVSSKYMKTKQKGSLFDLAINEMGISKKRILHIGDNPRGDYFVPKMKGITAVLLK